MQNNVSHAENEVINKEYDHIVSLGSFCMTAHHIRRRFEGAKAFPFDWWVTPTVALQELFESDFAELFIPHNMNIVIEDAGQAIMCQRYGLMHYHDFHDAKVNSRYVPMAIRETCAKNVEKYAHLLKRLYSLRGDVLFIRLETGYVQHFDNNRDFDALRLEKFVSTLRRFLPDCSVDLLLLNSFPAADLNGVFYDNLDHYGSTTWEGSEQGWDEMFNRTGIMMRPVKEDGPMDGTDVASSVEISRTRDPLPACSTG